MPLLFKTLNGSRALLAMLLIFLAPSFIAAEACSDGGVKHVRLLTIGNSFTHNATRLLGHLVEAAGHRLTHHRLIIGGSPLRLHAAKALAFEADRDDSQGRYAAGLSLQQSLASDRWDYVTIQQVSMASHDVASYQPYAAQLAEIVHRHAPQARLLVHQTWAYREDDPRFGKHDTEPGEPKSRHEMHRGLSAAYRQVARGLGARRIPVGDAFDAAESDSAWGFTPDDSFDPFQATPPELPDQSRSLHVGYHWRQSGDQWHLAMDGRHAGLAGEYLGACVWYAALYGESPVGSRFIPEGLDPEYARFLQHTAQQAVAKAEDAPRPIQPETVPDFDDPAPRRYRLQARASELDNRTREHPEIDFVFSREGRPQDVQQASVDTRTAPQGKLVIWLMGANESLFERLNDYGLHVIGVSYANKWFGLLCRPQPSDRYARGRVRLEAATGEDFSAELDLTKPDGAAERALQMVRWLADENPQGRWEQFLDDDRLRLRWDKIIVAGSSHGATTAARFAKHQRVDRVVMLCGPRDQDQDWQALPSATPPERYFGFSHVLDDGWTGDHYCRSWDLLGLDAFGPSVNVDETGPPYANSRRLISAADVGGDAGRAHAAVTPGRASPQDAVGQLLYEPVWRYLFNHPHDAVGEPIEVAPDRSYQK